MSARKAVATKVAAKPADKARRKTAAAPVKRPPIKPAPATAVASPDGAASTVTRVGPVEGDVIACAWDGLVAAQGTCGDCEGRGRRREEGAAADCAEVNRRIRNAGRLQLPVRPVVGETCENIHAGRVQPLWSGCAGHSLCAQAC